MRPPIQIAILFLSVLQACTQKPAQDVVLAEESLEGGRTPGNEKLTLSAYNFFDGDLKNLEPKQNVYPYDVNSPLFSDYAFKARFVYIPKGKQMRYDEVDTFGFPDGAVLIKNFFYPEDEGKPEGNRHILETRLLLFERGEWRALTYVWNEEQTEATLELAGKSIAVTRHAPRGDLSISYSVPSVNQCRSCHLKGEKTMPIGLSARQLNQSMQLEKWKDLRLLESLPNPKDIPILVSYEDSNVAHELRARSWLESNCAHCHRPDGQAKNSGLHLNADVTSPLELGVGKAPVAAGKGTGGRLFSIVPGRPDASILVYRIESVHPGEMMPEIGRSVVHQEGVALIRKWIEGMGSKVQ